MPYKINKTASLRMSLVHVMGLYKSDLDEISAKNMEEVFKIFKQLIYHKDFIQQMGREKDRSGWLNGKIHRKQSNYLKERWKK